MENLTLPKTTKPLNKPRRTAASLSIESVLTSTPVEESTTDELDASEENVPADDFTAEKLQNFWEGFLQELKGKDAHAYMAVHRFKVEKQGSEISITYGSKIAKDEFDQYLPEFLQQLKQTMNNYHLKLHWNLEIQSTKIEIETKRSIFEKLAEEYPVLKTLEEYFQLDFN